MNATSENAPGAELIPLLLVDVRVHPQDPPEIVRAVQTSLLAEYIGRLRDDRWLSIMGWDGALDFIEQAIQESDPPRAKQAAG